MDPQADVLILAIKGEWDASNFETFCRRIEVEVGSGCTYLIFHLRDLEFLDSSALAFLMRTRHRLQERGGDLLVSEPSEFFDSTARMLGIDRVLRIFESTAQALRYLREHGAVGTREGVVKVMDARLLGSGAVSFRLDEASGEEGVGSIRAWHGDGFTFHYPVDPGAVPVDPRRLGLGSRLRVRLHPPFEDPGGFPERVAEIVFRMDPGKPGEAATFRLRFVDRARDAGQAPPPASSPA